MECLCGGAKWHNRSALPRSLKKNLIDAGQFFATTYWFNATSLKQDNEAFLENAAAQNVTFVDPFADDTQADTLEKTDEADFWVWYDAKTALQIFELVQTQWRHGFNGITGLDYVAVALFVDRLTGNADDWLLTMTMIGWLETGCLLALSKQREKEEAKRKT